MVFQRILVPLDGSVHSHRALEVSVQLAKKFNSKLFLLTVISNAERSAPEPEMSLHAKQSLITTEEILESYKEMLAESEEKVRSEAVEVESDIADGNPVDAIIKKSKEGNFDVIVMGARGLSTLKKILVGSVSEGVIKSACCPVLIVK